MLSVSVQCYPADEQVRGIAPPNARPAAGTPVVEFANGGPPSRGLNQEILKSESSYGYGYAYPYYGYYYPRYYAYGKCTFYA